MQLFILFGFVSLIFLGLANQLYVKFPLVIITKGNLTQSVFILEKNVQIIAGLMIKGHYM